MRHREMCELGAKWLKNHKSYVYRCNYVAVELVSLCNEIPDVYGYKGDSRTILLEAKTSRADFLRDKKKIARQNEGSGVGMYRYFLCPESMIKLDELPAGWGLLYIDADKRIKPVKQSDRFEKRDYDKEMTLMYSIMRRLANGRRQVFNFKNNNS